MDITQIAAAKVAGTVTTKVVTESVVQHIPADHAFVEVTAKKFDPYTGVEIDPEITQFRKTSLLSEVAGIDKQIENLNTRKKAINDLLAEFLAEEVKIEPLIIEKVY